MITDLCTHLRALDTERMSPEDLLASCLRAVPAATPPDVIAALRAVADEQFEHARQLERYARTRRAGIVGVIDGGGPEAA